MKQPSASVARNLDGEATLPGPYASAITKLSDHAHEEVLNNESHVACLDALKDKFGLMTSATTTLRLLKAFLNALYV